jgi:Sec-independent protein translocase protein TatA
MVLLSPPKLFMILVIALVVLGPDKLPSAARRIGAAWSDFQRWRARLEGEVRATFPDLPSTTEIARAVRSPISLLDRLAEDHGAASSSDAVGETSGESTGEASPGPHSAGLPVSAGPPTASLADLSAIDPRVAPDMSSMN